MGASADDTMFTEMKCGTNFAYILNDNSRFLTTEYKVLQSQTGGSFLRSMKMSYNGKTELYYMTDGCKTFDALAPVLDADRFLTAAGNLLDAVGEVKNNGFLVCRNLDIRFDKIYVELSTYKIRLVYLPAAQPFFRDDGEFENELRAGLVKMIDDRADRELPSLRRLAADLADNMLSLEETAVRLRGGEIRRSSGGAEIPELAGTSVHLAAMSAPHMEIKVTKDPFVIGKKAAAVDGAVTFNPMISRVHCRICQAGGGYTVTDLKSSNGTFINNVRLTPEQAYPLKNGDILRLANTDFQVVIR